jgi:hypothetical protein
MEVASHAPSEAAQAGSAFDQYDSLDEHKFLPSRLNSFYS